MKAMIGLSRKKHYFIVLFVIVSFLFTFVAPAFAEGNGGEHGNGNANGNGHSVEAPSPPSPPDPPASGRPEGFSPPGQENKTADAPPAVPESPANPGSAGDGGQGSTVGVSSPPADTPGAASAPNSLGPAASPGNSDHNEGVGQDPEQSNKVTAAEVPIEKLVVQTLLPDQKTVLYISTKPDDPDTRVGGGDENRWPAVPVGGYVDYLITVTNNSGQALDDIEVWDNPPPHTSVVPDPAVTTAGYSEGPGKGKLTWSIDLGTNASSNQASIKVRLKIETEAPKVRTNEAKNEFGASAVTQVAIFEKEAPSPGPGPGPGPSPGPGPGPVPPTITGAPEFAIFLLKVVSHETAKPGDILTYALHWKNTGTATLTNVVLTDAIPAGTTYVEGSAITDHNTTVSLEGGVLVWRFDKIDPNTSGIYTFQVRINDATRGEVENVAVIKADQVGPVESRVKTVVAVVAPAVFGPPTAPVLVAAPPTPAKLPAALPFTGANLLVYFLSAVFLIGTGIGLQKLK